MFRKVISWAARWGITVILCIVSGYVVWYAGLCRMFGSSLDACSLMNNGLEIYVIAAVLMALVVVVRL